MDEMCRAYCSTTVGSLPIITIAFDHRNHGERAVGYDLGNVGWPTSPEKEGNPMHAVDMYAIQHGTAKDISFLIDHLPAALEVDGRVRVVEWGVSGISLGGHSSLLAVMNDARISFAIPIVGCGDYETLMRDRHQGILARHRDLVPWGKAFPPSLQALVRRVDPIHRVHSLAAERAPTAFPRILFLGGGNDKLVPVSASELFWTKLTEVYQVHGQLDKLTWVVDDQAGHECSGKMAEVACKWLS
ncbi:Alpha/Beta hydrolase protein [Catenaria anguillulae PL171]|uniref:Alpha/Beta hydrolase protein n=1 Tax=Catenaria anguillulae PL171 TaxID=765915 RepID=A0A1Y2HAK7_9FUNG|nr:Alpha/Beta hydrolase protein [Catenaria anguillulae PL171]